MNEDEMINLEQRPKTFLNLSVDKIKIFDLIFKKIYMILFILYRDLVIRKQEMTLSSDIAKEIGGSKSVEFYNLEKSGLITITIINNNNIATPREIRLTPLGKEVAKGVYYVIKTIYKKDKETITNQRSEETITQ